MTSNSYQQLTNSINNLLGLRRQCTCGRAHETSTRQVIIGSGAVEKLPGLLAAQGLTGRGLLVADENTYQAAGKQASQLLQEASHSLERLLFTPQPGRVDVEATDKPLELVRQRAADSDYLIAVGSGTINDICKLASTRLGIPYVAVATAPSMTGYPSGIAAMLSGAIKETLPAVPPVAVVADLDVLAAAPARMRAAGVGDLISRSLSSTDWKLAALVRGDYFCGYIATLVDKADQHCRTVVADIRQGQPQAIGTLTAGLILAGIGMKMAETSAPGSGGGHLISHYWDMTASARGRQRNLHGLQVALGDLICAVLYERMWPRIAEVEVDDLVAERLPAEDFARETYDHYAPLVGLEPAEQIAQSTLSKYATDEHLRQQLELVTADPSALWQELAGLFTSSVQLKEIFGQVGIPGTAAELGISQQELVNAYRFASRFRARYTVLDMAYDLGLLKELQDEVLSASGVAQ